jgi:hypothetical protein
MRPQRRIARATLASAEAAARRNPTHEARQRVDTLRAEYRTLALEDYIRETVDAAPPLTTEQRERLAIILRGSA